MYSCEKENTNVIDPVLNIPRLDSATFTPDSFDTSHLNIQMKAYVTSIDPVGSVSAKVINPLGLTDSTISLSFNGSFFEGTYNRIPPCWLIGNYRIEFVASTTSGLPSNTVTGNFQVTNTSSARPLISIIYAPDSLQRASGVGTDTLRPAFLKVQVTDPNGECDILGAYFNAYNPNGVPNPSNPFPMYDDGDVTPPHCDTIANDGKYSLMIYIGPTATIGNFSFRFNGEDRSNVVSDTLTKLIYVYP